MSDGHESRTQGASTDGGAGVEVTGNERSRTYPDGMADPDCFCPPTLSERACMQARYPGDDLDESDECVCSCHGRRRYDDESEQLYDAALY